MGSWVREPLKAFERYRTTPLSTLEHSLIQDVLKNSSRYAQCLILIFSVAIFALWGHVPTTWLMLFLLVFAIEILIKVRTSRRFESLPPEQQQHAVWRLIFDAGSTYSGLAYGLASLVLFYPMPEENRLLLIGAFCALISNLSAASAFFTSVTRTMLPCLAVPVSLVLLFSGESLLVLLGLLVVVSISITMVLSRLSQRRYRHILWLNQKNKALVNRLSEQKQIATEHRARAEQAVVDKSRFLAMASHDLRQPLHALGLFHHALRLKCEDPSNGQLFESIDKSTDALNAMFDSLLDVSRLDANVTRPEFEPVQLESVFSLLKQEFQPVAQERGLYFRCQSLPVCLLTDATLLARILRNLISNAIKFTAGGGVIISAESSSSELRIMVSDTGRGIPEAERQNVFSEFYQLDVEVSEGSVGVGLGLSIVRRLCELLDVNISLDVGESGGTIVTLSMSCLNSPECSLDGGNSPNKGHLASLEGSPGNALGLGSDQAMSLQGCSILFIDDDPETCQAMGNTLKQWGCVAICEPDADSALARLDSLGVVPDMLISDFQLANGENGLTAIDSVFGQLGFELPAILVSGICGLEDIALIQCSGYPCLTKPVSARVLKQLIETTMVESRQGVAAGAATADAVQDTI